MSTLLIAHGSPDARHQVAIADLARRAERVTSTTTTFAFLEHNQPSVATALQQEAKSSEEAPQTLGLFLSAGHHAQVDVPEQIALSKVAGVAHRGHLGTGPWLIPALEEQLEAIGLARADGVAVVAAGSPAPEARDEVIALASTWQRQRGTPVRPAFASGEGPSSSEALGMLRDSGCEKQVMALLMLAPGVLADRVIAAGRENNIPVSAPLIEGVAVVDRIAQLTAPA